MSPKKINFKESLMPRKECKLRINYLLYKKIEGLIYLGKYQYVNDFINEAIKEKLNKIRG